MTDNTSPTYSQTLRHLADAVEPVQPYWDAQAHGRTDVLEPPAATLAALADAIASAPPEHLEKLANDQDANGGREMVQWLKDWHQDYTERRIYRRFFELMAQIGRLNEEERKSPQMQTMFFEMMRCAPPRYFDCAAEVVADELPRATLVNDEGQPVYTLEQVADACGKTPEEVAEDVERLHAAGLLDKDSLHTGPVHPLQ